jgi:hypothetical protein
MKGINTPGQALDSGGVASFSTPRDGVSHLAFPALARERNHHADSFPLAPLGNERIVLKIDCFIWAQLKKLLYTKGRMFMYNTR